MSIRFGIAGAGYWASRVPIPSLISCSRTLPVAVCDVDKTAVRNAMERFEIPFGTTSYSELLDQDLDAVLVATPPRLHRQMVVEACERGLHVICEKPFAMNVTEARSMLEAAETAAVVHMIDNEQRYLPARLYMSQLLQEGFIGRPLLVRLAWLTNFRVNDSWSWWSDLSMGGGALYAAASHQVDALRVWCGEVEAVTGCTATFIRERTVPGSGAMRRVTADDSYGFMLRFTSGTIGSVLHSYVVHPERPIEIAVHGDAGTIRLVGSKDLFVTSGRDPEKQVVIPRDLGIVPGMGHEDELSLNHKYHGAFLRLLHSFVDAIETNQRDTGPTFHDGLKVQQVIDAVRVSSAAGWTSVA